MTPSDTEIQRVGGGRSPSAGAARAPTATLLDRPRRDGHDCGVDRSSLIGRERERALIRRALDEIRDGGRAVVVDGEAGIGKSALLADATAGARDRGMTVLSATGVQTEAHLPFAGLHQLLRPVLAEVRTLPVPQRQALQAALGMGDAATRERFLIALATLGLLTGTASARPVVLSIEDAQWLDRASAEALAFVGRRLESDPVVMLVAIREGYVSPLNASGLPGLHVDRLDEAAVAQLLDDHFPELTSAARERVIDEAQENPLALTELGAAPPSDPRYPGAGMYGRLPVPARLERAFAARAAELPAPARTMLLVAAMVEEGLLSTVLAAAGTVDGALHTVEDLVPATRSKLVEVVEHRVRFRHPLVRSAIYQAASLAERQAVHSALAELFVGDPDRSVWHRSAAAVGPDQAIASDLADAGRRAQRRGAVIAAAAAFERAAALTPETVQRGRLLLAAAAAASDFGRGKAAVRQLRETDLDDLGSHDRALWMLLEDSFYERPASVERRFRSGW